MQTLERATALLKGAGSQEGLAELVRQLGFGGQLLPLDAVATNALHLPGTIRAASIAQGVGSIRGLALDFQDDADLRQSLTAVANALARHSPQLLWIVIATRNTTGEVAIVCWSSSGSRTRIASLLCNRDRLFESDAETLCALASATSDSDLLTYSRWLDILGREAITRRFFRILEKTVAELAASADTPATWSERHELALLYVSRLIFLSFLETKGWLNGDFGFLINGYSECMATGGSYQSKVLEPLFFGTLNTTMRARSGRARSFGRIPFLNGGLFSRSSLEKLRRGCVFSDDSFGNAYGSLFSRYRFSAREDSAVWSEASIDPEMLGKAFEALMGAGERKSSGAFYTPQTLVEEVAEEALRSALDVGGPGSAELERLRNIRVLDPACGSGAFLVHVLERIASLCLDMGERGSIAEIRRRVLTTSIFGVDLNPMAVWLCELRLWLAIVIESAEGDPMQVVPLPNLDRHIRVGDSLSGGAFDDALRLTSGRKLASLRNRYMRASGPRKRTLAKAMDRAERNAAIEVLHREGARLTATRKELLIALRAKDLFGDRQPPGRDARLRLLTVRSQIRNAARAARQLRNGAALPFSFAAHFSDVAVGGGFDLVIGNPPWVRLHQIAESSRARLRSDFVVYRTAAWESGAGTAGVGRGFAAQIDMSALFVERSCELLRPAGTMALLLPSKLWRSLAGGGVRQLLLDQTNVVTLEDLAESPSQFDAAAYPSLLVSRKRTPLSATVQPRCSARIRLPDRIVRWSARPEALRFDDTPGSPWILLPPLARNAFERIRNVGTPFAGSAFGRPMLGVKTGCNRAYVVRVDGIEDDIASISAGDRRGWIEREMLRPLVRGETLGAWKTTGQREYLVWPHCDNNLPRKELPPLVRRWLLPFRDQLGGRTDLRGRLPWWTVFRTESARHQRARVVWADFGLTPRAMVIERGDPIVPLNTCYAVSCDTLDDAHGLAALLNGPLVSAWLNVVAEPARGGYRRYLGWTVSLLPLPSDWECARQRLAPLGARAMSGDVPSADELLAAALDAYRVTLADIQPLLSWQSDCD
ncbi:MAG TPA: N-6 DNA methylase [Gemmatimonadaceae bacterium]|nr:N-6 DNA methylase [Gemmatimonadaceae bacterium]